ncbi:UDP-glucose 4-epimerase [Caenispirillum salinarum AK4]|uniref:UDP-glucose 4-epimerase n=1 Tax=Caenispirillum salinarum AK4 TaxID=1238182 RepID=K9GQF9_9PROT|nr:NAD-dependent epimerase/dehydratase family protein [Caenispirillum salinarum]EKV28180.1 UDP-glucose 4-epimerase [Caenispirillum salinarum AK4]
MSAKILITGGAGFIGSHLADALLARGHHVRVFDNLSPQVHGKDAGVPDYLSPDVEFMRGDVRDANALRQALEGVDAVYHLAAMVGVGQSMYQIDDYTAVNDLGTATLLQLLIERPVKRLVVASSMSIYGEGLYEDEHGALISNATRSAEQLKKGQWEPVSTDGLPLTPIATPESKQPELASIYALGKYAQERMCLITGQAYGIPTTAMRFFNVYGTRQALSNPYTGVLAIFASRLLNGKAPRIFEDGRQRRDFVHVKDVARACADALDRPESAGHAINIGSGNIYTVEQIAATLARTMGRQDIAPEVTGEYRVGDIRHCFADLTNAEKLLGFRPEVGFDEGLGELVEWVASQTAEDRVGEADKELRQRGLVA